MAGLLGDIYSAGDSLKRRVRGLLDDPQGTVSQLVGMLRDDSRSNIAATNSAFESHDPNKLAQAMLDQNRTATGFAPLAMTAWHGSPHTFDKFSLDKIGTGEGAQAYGHGLYLAESPDVAKGYQEKLSKSVSVQGRKLDSIPADGPLANAHNSVITNIQGGMKPEDAIRAAAKYWDDASNEMLGFMQSNPELASHIKKEASSRADIAKHAKAMNPADFYLDPGNLYKTDIPDEAVARFLDWDKPLSQQAPEVQRAFKSHIGEFQSNPEKAWELIKDKTGGEAYSTLAGRNQHLVSDGLNSAGIPGIRYLDGGSRGTGTGTSNFVAFSPDLIRILERNGQPTGAVPWQPGEWQQKMAGLLSK